MKRAALAAIALAACSSSSSAPPAADAGDGGGVLPPAATCVGDASRCVQGKVRWSAFAANPNAAKVELYRVFPTGATPPIATIAVDANGRFAFSNVDAWDHYFVKAVLRFGDGASAVSVGALRGPLAAGATADVDVLPAQLEVLEIVSNGARKLQYASAHLFDPGGGHELVDATVTFSSKGLAPLRMPFVTNAGGSKSYYASLTSAPAGDTGFTITSVHPAINDGKPVVWNMAPEPQRFAAPTLATPKEGATVAANQPLNVSWSAATGCDYALIELFQQTGTTFAPRYASPESVAPTTTTATIPASAIPAPGSYLVNVDAAQAGCQVAPAQGCTYLLQPTGADISAQ